MELTWAEQEKDLALAMAAMGHRQFIVIQYVVGLDPNPYAQAAPELDGTWYLEVVSTHFLPECLWPIDQYYLWQHDWESPDVAGENWARAAHTTEDAAALLIKSLSRGRQCLDPSKLQCEIGRWDADPGRGPKCLSRTEPVLVAS